MINRKTLGSVIRCGVAAATLAGLAACDVPATTSDAYELANMDPRNVIPKSTPKAFVASFEKYCLDEGTDTAAIERALRSTDYVRVPGNSALRSWVVDDKRPAVIVAADGLSCAVAAQARTGQTERVREMVSNRFPGAIPVPANMKPKGMESLWLVDADKNIFVFTKRRTPLGELSQLILVTVRLPPGQGLT
jgi:hypothetical protein